MTHPAHAEWDTWTRDVTAAGARVLPDIVRRCAEGWHNHGEDFRCKSPLRHAVSDTGFVVSPRKGLWYDFGLGQGGDALAFLQSKHRITSFREAIDLLAKEANVESWDDRKRKLGLARTDPEALERAARAAEETHRIHTVLSDLVHLCHAYGLPSRVRQHLQRHYQFTDDFIDLNKIGFVPAGLYELAVAAFPYTPDELLASGFFVRTSEGIVAACAQRILFPYWTAGGLCCYTIGREYFAGATKDDAEVPEFDRGKYKKHLTQSAKFPYVSPHISNEALWGEETLAAIPPSERSSTWVYLAEGIPDAMMLAQLGLPVVSPVTVSISNKQIDRSLSVTAGFAGVIIANDNEDNRSGEKGARRTAAILWANARKVRISTLPRPPGVSKVDVNELVGAWLREGLSLNGARDRFVTEVGGPAPELPAFILASLDPALAAAEVETSIAELGSLAAPLSILQQHDLLARIVSRFPKLPRGALRAAFMKGVRDETARRTADAKKAALATAASPGDPSKLARLRSVVFDEVGSYERVLADGTRERISSFSLIATRRIISEERGVPDRLEVNVVGPGCVGLVDGWIVDHRAWASKRAFVAALPSLQMQWFGSDEEVQAIYELLTDQGVAHLPALRATNVIGLHELPGNELRFVLPAGTLDRSGWMENPDLVFVSTGGSTIQHRLPKERSPMNEATSALARRALEQLPGLHAPTSLLPLACWFAASACKPYILSQLGGFAILDLSASPGSGKTSLLAWILWPFFCGVLPGELMSSSDTPFATLKNLAASNAIPALLDEFKPPDMRRDILDFMRRIARRLWSGEVETRGRADQSVAIYTLAAPTAFIGESSFDDDPATSERCLHLSLDRNWLTRHPEAQQLFAELRGLPLSHVGPLFQTWTLTCDRAAFLERAQEDVGGFLGRVGRSGDAGARTRVVLVCVAFGYRMLEAFAANLGARPALGALDAHLHASLAGTFELDEKGELGRTLLDAYDRHVIDASRMATLGILQEGTHYAWIAGKLFLHLAGIEAARAAWLRGQGAAHTSPGPRSLKKVAREKLDRGDSYVVDVDHRARLGDDRRGCGVLIDLRKVPDRFETDDFPMSSNRTWGGHKPTLEVDASRPWASASRRSGGGERGGGDSN